MIKISAYLQNGNIQTYTTDKLQIQMLFTMVKLKELDNAILCGKSMVIRLDKSKTVLFINATLIKEQDEVKIYSESQFENSASNKALYSFKKYIKIKYKCNYYSKRSQLGITASSMIDWNYQKKELIKQKFYKNI